MDDADARLLEVRDRGVACRLGEVDLHHGRHRVPGGRREPALLVDAGRARQGRHEVRQGRRARRRAAAPADAEARHRAARCRPDAAEAEELAQLVASMEGTYGKGKYCKKDAAGKETCQDIGALEPDPRREPRREGAARRLDRLAHHLAPDAQGVRSATSSSPTRARASWASRTWARMWRAEVRHAARRLREGGRPALEQVRPLYASLHATCGASCARSTARRWCRSKGPIPAHLLGNMWAQEWAQHLPAGRRPADADPGYRPDRAPQARRATTRRRW